MESCKVIAEIGCNHKGDINIAKELINIAKSCGCTCAKFQKRNPKELLSEEQYNAPHPVPKILMVIHTVNIENFWSSL